MAFSSVEEAIDAMRDGRMIIVVDDENRENEGDLLVAADRVTPEDVAFMMREGRGLICVALTGERLDTLGIPLMVRQNGDAHSTAFTVAVDYRSGTSTGISASDRAATVRALVDPAARADDFARPGHMFPLRARQGGVMERPGHTEAAIDLTRLAGLPPGGVICEIANDDGSMARLGDLRAFSAKHAMPIVTIESIIRHLRDLHHGLHDVAA